jgi:hypothetical protein
MNHPTLIRTDFISAEDAAHVYGIPQSRVETIQRALAAGKESTERSRNARSVKPSGRNKKRRLKKK